MNGLRTSHVFPRHCKAVLPIAVGGEGCYLIDSSGKRYLDGSGGAAVSCLGHSDRSVQEAVKDQMDKLAFAHTGFFTSEAAEELADLLVSKAPSGIDRVYFVSGGSEAVEAAIKLARQYFVEIGEPQRHRLIARRQSYHGNTLGALSASGNMRRRELFEPLLVECSQIAPCYAYREQNDDETLEDYGLRAANELQSEIERAGPENIMAFIAEPVVGATIGAVPPTPGYYRRIREICDRYGILLILDEVMCGMGRTGTLFACKQDGVAPDIVTIAKGLGAGYQPIGAMLCAGKIYDAIAHGSGFFQHGHTYIGHQAACAGGAAVLRAFEERNLVSRAQEQGQKLEAALYERFGQHPNVGDLRRRGLFRGIELVADRGTKRSFDPAHKVYAKIKSVALEHGLICYPMGGALEEVRGDHVMLAPPFIIEDAQIEELVDKLAVAIDTAIADAA